MSEGNRRWFRLVPSPSMVVALTALLFATAGTANAIHGGSHTKNFVNAVDVQDSSLTGADIKNKSLTLADFRGRGPRGATGARGPAGERGPAGANGQNGAQGPQGPAGTNGTNGANGRDGFALLDYNFATFTNTPNSQVGGFVRCDAGLRVVGGGVSTTGTYAQQQVNASYPSGDGGAPGTTAWTAFVDSYGGVTRNFTVWVICAPATQVTSTGIATGIATKKP